MKKLRREGVREKESERERLMDRERVATVKEREEG